MMSKMDKKEEKKSEQSPADVAFTFAVSFSELEQAAEHLPDKSEIQTILTEI